MTNNSNRSALDLGTAIHEHIEAVKREAYDLGVVDTLTAVLDFVNKRTGVTVAARRDAPLEAPVATPPRRKRRGLTPAEARIVDFVTANPGATMQDIRAAGIVYSPGAVYKLVALRKLRRTEDPKPHTGLRPWVHFYPMEPRNG